MDSNAVKGRFRELLDGPDREFALDEACLLICQLAGFEIDIATERARLDAVARGLAPSFAGVMGGLFAGPDAWRGNAADYYSLGNSMLSEVCRRRLGLPITLAVLAMESGRRRGVGVVGVALPGHFLVGSADDSDLFADPFDGGRLLDGDDVRAVFARVTGGRTAWNPVYLRAAPQRDIVLRVLNNIRVACTKNPADSTHLPWVLELLSWFPSGAPFDAAVAARSVARWN